MVATLMLYTYELFYQKYQYQQHTRDKPENTTLYTVSSHEFNRAMRS